MVQVSIMEDHQGRVEEKESTGGWQTRPLRQLRKGGARRADTELSEVGDLASFIDSKSIS